MLARYVLVLAACSPHPAAPDATSGSDDAAVADSTVDAALPSTARYWTHFNWPRAHGGADPTITNELVRMIDATPPGALIRGNFFELEYPRIAAALDAAYDRGVTMRITIDGGGRGAAPAAAVASHMGTSAGFCGGTDPATQSVGCITTTIGGIAHSKFMTFSMTAAPDGHVYPNVVWFGSYNAVDAASGGSGDADSNSATSIYDSPIAYEQLVAHQTRMQNQVHYPGNDYYDRTSGRGYFYDPNARLEVQLSPEAGPNLIYQQLLRITADPSCIVRVFQVVFTDSMLPAANQLAALARGGCRVFVLANEVGTQVTQILGAAGIEIRHLTAIHDKLFLIDAKYDGSAANRSLVFTGSHNWENKASYGNDELLAGIEDPAQYDAFYAHFLDGWHAALH